MAWQYAIDLQPKDKDGGADPSAIPLSRVLGVSIQYGKTAEAISYSAGQMLVQLDNSDGALTPGGGGTWGNARFVGVECDFYTTVTGESPDLGDYTPRFFSGNVTAVDVQLSDKFNSKVILTCTDALGQLGTYFAFCHFYDPVNTEGEVVAFGDDSLPTDGLMPFLLGKATSSQFTSTHYLINGGSSDMNVWAFPEYANIGDYLRRAIEAENGDFFVRHGLPIVRTAAGKRNLLAYRSRSGPTISDDPTLSVSHLEALVAYDTDVASPPAGARSFANAEFEVGTDYGFTSASFSMRTRYDYVAGVTLGSGASIALADLGRQSAVAYSHELSKLYLKVTANTLDRPVKIFVETAYPFGDWTTIATFVKLDAGETGEEYIEIGPNQSLLALNAEADSTASSGAITFQVTAYPGESTSIPQIAGDTTTQNTFGVQDLSKTDMFTASGAATLECAESYLQRYGPEDGDPMVLRSLSFPPVFPGDNDGWEMAKFSTGDAVSVGIEAAGSTMTFDGMIVGVRWDITPAGGATLTTFSENADLFSPFILDDSLFGVLDENLLG